MDYDTVGFTPHWRKGNRLIVAFDTDVKIARADFHPWW
jgi:hypothetical protein